MKKNLFVFVFFFLAISCLKKPSTSKVMVSEGESDKIDYVTTEYDSLTITAIDLSENMSRLSTKNDEVFVFIYDYSNTNQLSEPLISCKLIFDNQIVSHTVPIPKNSTKILFFIEEDSFRNLEQIEPVVRIYFKEIIACKDYNELEKYLGEDDLLGISIVDKSTKSFALKGMSSLDKFNYKFVIK